MAARTWTSTSPPASAGEDSFRLDPRNPVPTRGGAHGVTAGIGPADQRAVEERPDVLVYTSAPLEAPMLVVGRVKARLYASSTAPDTDFTAKLVAARRYPAPGAQHCRETPALQLSPEAVRVSLRAGGVQDRLRPREPIPWKARELAQTATVHVGGTLEEIAAAEKAMWQGKHPQKPFVLLAQQSIFDPSRAPEGKHTAWAYCHVPNGSQVDMSAAIENQIERFAPGFQDCILARSTRGTTEMRLYNPNYIGGDINGGVQDWRQTWTRPMLSLTPYATPIKGVYLCSSSTPPGGGVHGMCGHHASGGG